MKAIFLDVDGVLNSNRCKEKTPRGYVFVEDRLIENLKRIIDATGASVVLSSSWRNDTTGDLQLLYERLRSFGIEVEDVTINLGRQSRGNEILEWLDRHEEVTNFVILDDMGQLKPLNYFLVRTPYDKGLEVKHVIRAIQTMKIDYRQWLDNGRPEVKKAREEIYKYKLLHDMVIDTTRRE